MARLATGVVHGAQMTPETLRPLHELWTNQNFQDNWVTSVRADLKNFMEAIWNMDFDSLSTTDMKTWTQVLRLPVPVKPGDLEVAIMGLRAVVGYTEWKLGQLERRATQFFEMSKGDNNAT